MSEGTARIRQAMKRAAELQSEVDRWLADQTVRLELKVDDDRHAWELVARIPEPPPVDEWSIHLGEVIHHLRSGLNNVVFAVASKSAGGVLEAPENIQFPIFYKEPDFERNVNRLLGEARSELYHTVRAFQPFGQGEEFLAPGPALRGQHPLALLNDLSNADKHRRWRLMLLMTSLIEFGDTELPFTIEFDSLEGVDDPVLGPPEMPEEELSDGAVLLRQVSRAPIKAITARGRVQLAVGVATPAGPLDARVLAIPLIFLCGLVMLRMEDRECEIDEVYTRLSAAMGQ